MSLPDPERTQLWPIAGMTSRIGARTIRTASRRFPNRARSCKEAKIAGGNTAHVYKFGMARLTVSR
jgi:hypothetical protein